MVWNKVSSKRVAPKTFEPKVFRYDATKSHKRKHQQQKRHHVATYRYDATKKHHRRAAAAAAAPKRQPKRHLKKASQLASAIPEVHGDSVQIFTPAPLTLETQEKALEAAPPAPKPKKVKEYRFDPTAKRRAAARKRRAAQREARRAAR